MQGGEFIVDVFDRYASEHSVDEETRAAGGSLGRRVQQGWIRSRELDRAAFEAPIGTVYGPFESQYGYHLCLVEERLGYRRKDGELTCVVAEYDEETGLIRSVLARNEDDDERIELPDGVRLLLQPSDLLKLASVSLAVLIGGDILAQVVGQLAPEVEAGSFLGVRIWS